MFPLHLKPFLVSTLFVLFGSYNALSQCTGFPATLAEVDCGTFTALGSNQSVNSGATFGICANGPATVNYTGINLSGGIVRLCGNASISGSFNSGTIVVQCGSTLYLNSGLTMNQNITIINYGNVEITGNLVFQNSNNTFYNEGVDSRLIVSGNINFPQNNGQNAYLKNNGFIDIGGTFNALDGGFTCIGENSSLLCNVLNYGQNCGAPANRFTYGSGSGTGVVRFQTSANIKANFTNDASVEVHYPSTATITANGCGTNFGSATLNTSAPAISDPGPSTGGCALNCYLVLPINLLSFSGNCRNGGIALHWSTASENNNAYFLLQRSEDGLDWFDVANVHGAGNSASVLEYNYDDLVGDRKSYYYRLKQVDFNGVSTITQAVFIQCDNSSEGVQIFPNPISTDAGIVNFTNLFSDIDLSIYNALGQKCYSVMLNADTQNLDLSHLSIGVYYFTMSSKWETSTVKVIVE